MHSVLDIARGIIFLVIFNDPYLHSLKCSFVFPFVRSQMPCHTYVHCTHPHTHKHTHTRTRTHAHAHVHTHARTHTVPTQPLQVQVSTLSEQAVFISWQSPNPTNGAIIDYSVILRNEPGGQPIRTLTVNIEIASLDNLDLTNLYYSIAISARNNAGLGPESEPVFFGIEPVLTTMNPTSDVNTASTDTTAQPTSESTTSSDTSIPSTEGTTNFSTITAVLNNTYYIVRIVPPVVVGVFLIAMLVVTIIFLVHIHNVRERRKKGVYKFKFSNGSDDLEMQ